MIVLRSARCGQYGLLTGSCNQFPKGQPRSSGSRRRKALRNRFCICRHFRKRGEEGRTAASRCSEPRERGAEAAGRGGGCLPPPRPAPALGNQPAGDPGPPDFDGEAGKNGEWVGRRQGKEEWEEAGEASWLPSSPGLRPTPGPGRGPAALGAAGPRSDSQVLLTPASGRGTVVGAGERETLAEQASPRTVSEDAAAAAARSRPSATSPTCQ